MSLRLGSEFCTQPSIGGNVIPSLRDFDDEVDLHGDIKWQCSCSEGGAGVLAAIAEDLDEELGRAVDDGWMAVEIWVGVYKAVEGYDLLHCVESANSLFDDGEAVEDNDTCTFHCVLDGADGGNLAEDFDIVINRQPTRKKQEVAAADVI